MKNLVTLLLLALGSSGCALTTETITLEYVPQPGVSATSGASSVVVDVRINDQRQDKTKVSAKKNGFGKEMAPILASEEVAVTIRKAIEQELRARGFSVGSDAVVLVVGDLTRFWNDHKMGFFAGNAVADLNMGITARNRKGDVLYTRQIVAQGVEPNTQLATGNNARLALNQALANGMKMLFEDQAFVTALLESAKPAAVPPKAPGTTR